MIHGTYTVKRVIETSACYICQDYSLSKGNSYKIFSKTLTPDIGGGIPPLIIPEGIDGSIIKNGGGGGSISCQNFLTTKYAGESHSAPKGTRYTLTCLYGNPNVRSFDKNL